MAHVIEATQKYARGGTHSSSLLLAFSFYDEFSSIEVLWRLTICSGELG